MSANIRASLTICYEHFGFVAILVCGFPTIHCRGAHYVEKMETDSIIDAPRPVTSGLILTVMFSAMG